MSINKFCGPYAYGKVMGISSNEAAAELRQWDWRYRAHDQEGRGNGRSRPVCGILGSALRNALAASGKVIGEIKSPGMKVATWAAVRMKWADPNAWVLFVSGHFVVYRQGIVYDNQHPTGVALEKHEVARQRIKSATCVSVWDDANPFRVPA